MGRRPGLNANNFTLPVPQWHYCEIKTPTSEHQGQYLPTSSYWRPSSVCENLLKLRPCFVGFSCLYVYLLPVFLGLAMIVDFGFLKWVVLWRKWQCNVMWGFPCSSWVKSLDIFMNFHKECMIPLTLGRVCTQLDETLYTHLRVALSLQWM